MPEMEEYGPTAQKVIRENGGTSGFGLLTNSFVIPHFSERHYEPVLGKLVRSHAQVLGLGIDEATALVVHGEKCEVIGKGSVSFYLAANPTDVPTHRMLHAGETFDLASIRTSRASRPSPARVNP
jgi:cyanophycinase-like exopeptidase